MKEPDTQLPPGFWTASQDHGRTAFPDGHGARHSQPGTGAPPGALRLLGGVQRPDRRPLGSRQHGRRWLQLDPTVMLSDHGSPRGTPNRHSTGPRPRGRGPHLPWSRSVTQLRVNERPQ